MRAVVNDAVLIKEEVMKGSGLVYRCCLCPDGAKVGVNRIGDEVVVQKAENRG
jgi:hypothetical protein